MASADAAPLVLPDVDARHAGPPRPEPMQARAAAAALGPQALYTRDTYRGGVRQAARLDGFLARPSRRPAAEIALGYVRAHPELLHLDARDLRGLRLARDYVSVDGTHHVSWGQSWRGIPAFDNSLRANVTRDGRLINVGGSPRHALRADTSRPALTAAQAGAAAVRDARSRGARARGAQLVLFGGADRVRLAWRLTVEASPVASYDYVVDAAGGRVLRRSSNVDFATARVWEHYPAAPAGGEAQDVDISPWLYSSAKRLEGNNGHVFADVNGDSRYKPSEDVPPSDAEGNFSFPFFTFGPGPCAARICSWDSEKERSWKPNVGQDSTQAFYFVNKYHDHLMAAPIGFTEAAGNFQRINYTGKGKGRDPLEVRSFQGADVINGFPPEELRNNAFMATQEDGKAPNMTLNLFTRDFTPFGLDTNPGDDADVVYHEYTHGLSNRLVVDEQGVSTLEGQGNAMGEGWSDWYAIDYLALQGIVVDTGGPGEIKVGVAESASGKGIRTQALDCPVGPAVPGCPGTRTAGGGGYTYGDYGKVDAGGPEVHADGEIWAETLWDLRARLIADHGPEEGVRRAESIITRGMELSLPYPSFLDMRNGILQADQVAGGGDRDAIWQVFARRGMGFFSSTSLDPNDPNPEESFALPPPPSTPRGTLRGRIRDSLTRKGVRGAVVSVPGLLGSSEGLFGAETDKDGRFDIGDVPAGTYPLLQILRPGYDVGELRKVRVGGAGQRLDIDLDRDWASVFIGGRIVKFTGVNTARFGCGPRNAIDQDKPGWATDSPRVKGRGGPKSVTVKLPRRIDIAAFGVDPGASCDAVGADPTSSAGRYRIETSTGGRRFTRVRAGRFRSAQNFRLNNLRPRGGSRGVRYVRFVLISPQGPDKRSPESGFSYQEVMGMTELEVYGTPPRR